jgi:hypothetical protein
VSSKSKKEGRDGEDVQKREREGRREVKGER